MFKLEITSEVFENKLEANTQTRKLLVFNICSKVNSKPEAVLLH